MKFAALVLAAAVDLASAWWDEGHMLVGAVARELLSKKQVEAVERPLKHWAAEFDNVSDNIIAAAVWPDHIKCSGITSICEGFDRPNGLGVFNTWHYMMIPYNPQNITLLRPFDSLPWPGSGAVFTLNELLRGPWHMRHWQQEHHPWDSYAMRSGRHDKSYAADTKIKGESSGPLSAFSWNIRLRFIIHIMGDIHQPLHVIETFTKKLPHGDMGGNLWSVRTTTGRIMRLHAFWDSCAEQYEQDWPQMKTRDVQAEAKRILREFPPEAFEPSRLNFTSFRDIAEDSYNVAVQNVFKFINLEDPSAGEGPVYQLAADYEAAAKKLCRQQIALGGYRLAKVLQKLYTVALDDWLPDKDVKNIEATKNSKRSQPYRVAAVAAIVDPTIGGEGFKAPDLGGGHHHLRLSSVIFGVVLGAVATLVAIHVLDRYRTPESGNPAEEGIVATSSGYDRHSSADAAVNSLTGRLVETSEDDPNTLPMVQ